MLRTNGGNLDAAASEIVTGELMTGRFSDKGSVDGG